jgi:hypothetical protein
VVQNNANGMSTSAVFGAALCGGSNGNIDMSISGGASPYTYLWSAGGVTSQDISGLAAGTYVCSITDATGCLLTASFVLPASNVYANVTGLAVTNASCSSCNDGAINLSVASANGPFTYLWNTGATTQDLSGLAPGAYTVSITNSLGCVLDTTVQVGIGVAVVVLEQEPNFKLFPNPTSTGVFYLDFEQAPTEALHLQLCNALGQVVFAQDFEAGTVPKLLQLELPNQTTATYWLRLRIGNQLFVRTVLSLNPR